MHADDSHIHMVGKKICERNFQRATSISDYFIINTSCQDLSQIIANMTLLLYSEINLSFAKYS